MSLFFRTVVAFSLFDYLLQLCVFLVVYYQDSSVWRSKQIHQNAQAQTNKKIDSDGMSFDQYYNNHP